MEIEQKFKSLLLFLTKKLKLSVKEKTKQIFVLLVDFLPLDQGFFSKQTWVSQFFQMLDDLLHNNQH